VAKPNSHVIISHNSEGSLELSRMVISAGLCWGISHGYTQIVLGLDTKMASPTCLALEQPGLPLSPVISKPFSLHVYLLCDSSNRIAGLLMFLLGRFLYQSKSCQSQTGRTNRAPVAHTCNPSYSGGRDQEERGLKPAQGK
jgi:hypothetical protein